VTAVLDMTPDATAGDLVLDQPLASWLARVGAFSVDVLLGIAVIATMAVLALTAPLQGWLWWIFVGAAVLTFVAMAVNRLLVPTITGWSLGRALFGIAVRKPDGAPVGALRLLSRDLAHLLDTAALFVGWLWPLWDRRRRTFADLLLRTEVHKAEPPRRDMRQPTAVVLIAATLLCAAAVGLSYLVVYRHDRAVDTARQQIAEQGPRIVEQMLSYSVDTLQQDFSHAQSLTTDAYRPQLLAQQQAVQKAGATTNEYFAVSSAVLRTPQETADHMSMLLAMQGQRGANPNEFKFITATVRVDFDKSGDGQWRVANLTVLKKPQMNQAGR
jgi:Mce-associated membrane protein